MLAPFHLAFPVRDLEETEAFFVKHFGCEVGRTSPYSAVFNFFGHQVVAHKVPEAGKKTANKVDSKQVPVPHFGLVLPWEEWQALAEKLTAAGDEIEFVIEPYIRYEGTSGEQATMFLLDPSGNALEFKSFRQPEQAFAPWDRSEKDYADTHG